MSKAVIAFFVLLFVLHQDFWWKDDPRLIAGVVPISVAYHVVWTLLIAVGWFFVARFYWPKGLDDEAGEGNASGATPNATRPRR